MESEVPAGLPMLTGQPWVLALAPDWGAPRQATLNAIRAELAQLGAGLLVWAEDELLCFQADGRQNAAAPAPGATRQLLEELLRARGVTAAIRRGTLTLWLMDGSSDVPRWKLTRDVDESIPETLLVALRHARQSVVEPPTQHALLSRRELVVLSLVGALSLAATEACKPLPPNVSAPAASRDAQDAQGALPVLLKVNGKEHRLSVDPRVSLLDALREQLRLTGTKKGCDQGQCGACTVLVEGRRINACLTLAVMHDGEAITTIEGLGTPEKLHRLQLAFIEHDGFQCGYCTPGQIMSAAGVLDEVARGVPSHVTADLLAPIQLADPEIRERMSGNICRCAAYPNIVAAIRAAAGAAAGAST